MNPERRKRYATRLLWVIGAIAVLIALSPGLLYLTGLALLPAFPQSQTIVSTLDESAQEQWATFSGNRLGYGEPMRMIQIDPWSYAYHNIVRCRNLGEGSAAIHACVYYFPGYMAAFTVAAVHLHFSTMASSASFLDELRLTALSIWVTRNWSPQQVAVYLAEHK